MDYTLTFVWIAVLVLSVALEAVTVSLVSLWFVPASLIALLLSFFPSVSFWGQFLVFAAVSILLLIFARPVMQKLLKTKNIATNADSVIGETAIVTESIDNLQSRGQVKVKGQTWSARSLDPAVPYEVGEILTVVSIEGVKLICQKQ